MATTDSIDYDNQDSNYANSQGMVYQFNNGVPNQFWELSGVFKSQWRTRYDAFFVQDSWTRDRLTLQGAVRYEHAWSYYPESYIGGTRFFPTFTTIPASDGANFNDFMPRVGAAYDVFGNGRTSVKANWGKYVQPAQNAGIYTGAAPTSTIVTAATRSWTDTNQQLRRRLQSGVPGRVGRHGRRRRPLRGVVEQQLRYAESRLYLQLRAAQRAAAVGLSVRRRRSSSS